MNLYTGNAIHISIAIKNKRSIIKVIIAQSKMTGLNTINNAHKNKSIIIVLDIFYMTAIYTT